MYKREYNWRVYGFEKALKEKFYFLVLLFGKKFYFLEIP